LGTSVAAVADGEQPGFNLFRTDPNSTQLNFSATPIPADFFDPGSDPFHGIMHMRGEPLAASALCPPPPTLCPDDDLNVFDTVVERLGTAVLPGLGSTDTIDIELVELSLRSIAPSTVTYNGGLNPELWDVEACNSPSGSPPGTMTITHATAEGGTFTSELPVTPLFRFTRQTDGAVRYLDGATAGLTDTLRPPDPVRWLHADFGPLSCRSNFCTPDPFTEIGLLATHGILPACPDVPALPSKALWVLGAVLAGLSVWVLRRVSRRPGRAA
jgi:hypothetical protein